MFCSKTRFCAKLSLCALMFVPKISKILLVSWQKFKILSKNWCFHPFFLFFAFSFLHFSKFFVPLPIFLISLPCFFTPLFWPLGAGVQGLVPQTPYDDRVWYDCCNIGTYFRSFRHFKMRVVCLLCLLIQCYGYPEQGVMEINDVIENTRYLPFSRSAFRGMELEIRIQCEGGDKSSTLSMQYAIRSTPCHKEFLEVCTQFFR